MILVLIVQEVRLIADLMTNVLCRQPDFEVVACVATTQAALALLKQSKCDVILVSVTLPHNGAITLIDTMAQTDYRRKVLLTGLVEPKSVMLYWLEAGAAGYVHADESSAQFVQQIRNIAQGEYLLSPTMVTLILTRIGELNQQVSVLNGWQPLNAAALYSELTVRECEVLDLIEQDYTNTEIGHALSIEVGTVKNHVHNILDKLGVRSRHYAAIIARQALAKQLHTQN